MDNYEVLEQIGSGSTFLVLHKTENRKYVLKKIQLSQQTEKPYSVRSVHREMELISNLNNPYIVSHKGMWIEKDEVLCVVTEYCEKEDMASMIKKARGVYFPEEKLCKWFAQLLLAVDYLHSNRVLHKNIKCSNIYLTKDYDVQLGDFGMGKIMGSNEITSTVVGTPNHICPELLEDAPYGYKSDVWSLGCCIFEIAAHHPPFRAADMKSLIWKIKRSALSPLPFIYTSSLKQMMKSMLRKSPETRPTVSIVESLTHKNVKNWLNVNQAAEVLRHYHIAPYVRQCKNASAVYLPVKTTADQKEKSPEKAVKDKRSEISDINLADSYSSTGSEASGQNADRNVGKLDASVVSRKLAEMNGGGEVSLQRADALESLLELCARLLKQDKIDELSKVLRPFGEELVSSRETAIWLTKTLIAHHNSKA